jgi:hypothetical protein
MLQDEERIRKAESLHRRTEDEIITTGLRNVKIP